MEIDRLIIAATQSGAGKTTIATSIMAALARRRTVQPFKVGPDYIDPSYHSHVCGRASRNLDSWMTPATAVLELFDRGCRGADIAIVEGVMGLFDGRTGEGEAGSTAEVAKLLDAPVVLVIDAARAARSVAATVCGFRSFDPDVRLAGVILNRISGRRHFEAVAQPIEREAGIPVLGFLPRDRDLALPERYLGLVPAIEGPVAGDYFDRLRLACEQTIDINRLERIAVAARRGRSAGVGSRASLFPDREIAAGVRIAVARDRAFSFYYEDNLDLLRAWGGEIVEFSPLADPELPVRTGAIYVGGGFPELFASDLSSNIPLHRALREAAAAGMPVYGECGGYMYLRQQLTDAAGVSHPMAGLLPGTSSMQGAKLSLGYRLIDALGASPICEAGSRLRAHEFHWSAGDEGAPCQPAYAVDGGERLDGCRLGSVTASYLHLHFATSPHIAPHFVANARSWASGDGRATRPFEVER